MSHNSKPFTHKGGFVLYIILWIVILVMGVIAFTIDSKTSDSRVINNSGRKVDTTNFNGPRYIHDIHNNPKATKPSTRMKHNIHEDDDAQEKDPYDDPDFDDDFPGDEHDEVFLGNKGDPELYKE